VGARTRASCLKEKVLLVSDNLRADGQREAGSTVGTFEVSVKFMQNSTWQGQIHWVEKNQKQSFRSALEMIKLMDEALTEGTGNSQTINW